MVVFFLVWYNKLGDFMIIDVNELVEKELLDDVIIFQTDTVYGIGCLLGSKKGVESIYNIKKRDGNKPLAVLCANMEQVASICKNTDLISGLAEKYWPGALTLILPKKEIVGDYLTSGFDTVGVRIPNDLIALRILEQFGPMAVTSLNLSTEPAVIKYEEVLPFLGVVDYIVKGTDLSNISSTVYDVVNDKVLRQGEIIL